MRQDACLMLAPFHHLLKAYKQERTGARKCPNHDQNILDTPGSTEEPVESAGKYD